MITAVVVLSWAVLVVAGLWRLRTSGSRYVPSGRSIGAVGDRSLALNDRMAAVAHVHGDRESTTGAFGSDRRWPVWSGALRRWALLVSGLGGRGVTQPTLAYRSGLAGAAASLAAGARAGQSPTSSIRTLLTSEGDRLEPNLAGLGGRATVCRGVAVCGGDRAWVGDRRPAGRRARWRGRHDSDSTRIGWRATGHVVTGGTHGKGVGGCSGRVRVWCRDSG